MKRYLIGAAILLSLTLSTQAFGQSSLATISGTVADSTGALIPGVTITVTNTATNVVSTVLSNEAGAYTMPGLLPGTYKVSAELTGFQVQTYGFIPFHQRVVNRRHIKIPRRLPRRNRRRRRGAVE